MNDQIATRERCAACHKVSSIGFLVLDDVWETVVHPQFVHSILCIQCFVDRADEMLAGWDEDITFYPVSLRRHLSRQQLLSERVPWIPQGYRTKEGDKKNPKPKEENNATS